MKLKLSKGFTLIELLVVMAIIASMVIGLTHRVGLPGDAAEQEIIYDIPAPTE